MSTYSQHDAQTNIGLLPHLHRHIEILEAIFPPKFFTRSKIENHPAYKRWKVCREMIEALGRFDYNWIVEHSYDIHRILKDNANLIMMSGGDVQSLQLGDMRLFSHMKMLQTATHFESLLLEIEVGGYYKTGGYDTTLLLEDGLPDVLAKPAIDAIPLYIECKALQSAKANTIKQTIKHANRQLRNVTNIHKLHESEYMGVVALDATGVSGRHTLVKPEPATEESIPPQPVLDVIAATTGAINGPFNRSVGCVLVIWDEDQVIGIPPNRTMMILRRLVTPIFHSPAEVRCMIDAGTKLYEGFTVAMSLHWQQLPNTSTSWGPPYR